MRKSFAHVLGVGAALLLAASAQAQVVLNSVRDPFSFGNTGIVISIVADPAGNQVELIQRP